MVSSDTSVNNDKYWGDRLKKRKVPTLFNLTSGRLIKGSVHIMSQYRFIDDMNEFVKTGNFIVVTDVVNFHAGSTPPTLIYINLDHIVWMAPDSVLSKQGDSLRGEPIEKRRIKVTIQTSTAQEIIGTAHVKKALRSIDDLNLSKDTQRFLSLTNVTINNIKPPLPVIPFLAINRNQVVWIIPSE